MIFFRFIASWPEIEGCLYLVSISEMKVKDMARKRTCVVVTFAKSMSKAKNTRKA